MNKQYPVSCILPSFLEKYLINGDDSDVDDHDIENVNNFLAESSLGACVDCSEFGFYKHHDIRSVYGATDCMMFTFLSPKVSRNEVENC